MFLPVSNDHPFAGIHVRLQRANENIVNLDHEIYRFFQECDYPIIPNAHDKAWQDAVNYHRDLRIPKRFSVLSGEIVHHLRSILDHIVWIFSDAEYRDKHDIWIQFPVLCKPPDAKTLEKFERQIGGIPKDSRVRALITKIQPHQLGADAIDSPITIVHNMDRFDKHRELAIIHSQANAFFLPDTPDRERIVAIATAYNQGEHVSLADKLALNRAFKNNAIVLPQVAFAHFGKREGEPVVPSLKKLLNAFIDVVDVFTNEVA